MAHILEVTERESMIPVFKGCMETTYYVSTTNTTGAPEIYRVVLVTRDDGRVEILDVFVQRTNGRFAILNKNKHATRWNQVGWWVVGEHKKTL